MENFFAVSPDGLVIHAKKSRTSLIIMENRIVFADGDSLPDRGIVVVGQDTGAAAWGGTVID
ncbi:MAG: hypothetical protein O7C75_05205, partial [Verrucomicrobia bacterium]|nr:hypothetical protein [Verrucomicrobiota bacterium]